MGEALRELLSSWHSSCVWWQLQELFGKGPALCLGA